MLKAKIIVSIEVRDPEMPYYQLSEFIAALRTITNPIGAVRQCEFETTTVATIDLTKMKEASNAL